MTDEPDTEATFREALAERLRVSGPGIFAATLAVPFVLTVWGPTWFALAWGVTYFVLSAAMLVVNSIWPTTHWRMVWAVATALLFGAISISVLIWGSDHATAPWIAGMISMAYIAFEVATLPYLRIPRWYVGVIIVSASLVALTVIEIGGLVGLALVPLLLGMIDVAGRNRTLHGELDQRLDEAHEMLSTDPLTGLLNRRGLESRLRALDGVHVTMAVFDADRFKLINDNHGHDVGDQALIRIAEQLRLRLPDSWAIARHGGDEFVAVSRGSVDVPSGIVDPIHVSLGDHAGQVSVYLSTGMASGTLGENDRLLSEAGHALRHAKRSPKRVVDSRGSLRERFERSVRLTRIDDAKSPIVPAAQVIVDANGPIGCELLARWRTDEGLMLAPSQFMDMLVENGLLGQLDNLMLANAVQLAARLSAEGSPVQFVSSNLSASHLLDPHLVGRVDDLIRTHGIEPSQLMIEITESERLGGDRHWERAVQDLRELGISMAIDDFGAGYSSIARLQRLPITHLKIDRSLVAACGGPLQEIVRGVTRFCEASHIGVIAEGVENFEERRYVTELGIELFQGYLFGKPVPVKDLELALKSSLPQAPEPDNSHGRSGTSLV